MPKTTTLDLYTIRPLTKEEIDRRIDGLTAELFERAIDAEAERSDGEPQWIKAADLVRRMRPFMVMN